MKKEVFILLAILVGLNILVGWSAVYYSQLRLLKVTFFDVGQGDSIFIETPQGNQILIDGGPGSVVLEKLGREMPFWDRTIDLVVLSHAEHDHIRGLLDVLERYEVKNVLWTGVLKDTDESREWKELIEKEGARIFISSPEMRITEKELVLETIFPFEDLEGKELKNVNDTSLVLKLSFGEKKIIFTGDISKSAEKKILEKGNDIDSNVLKVAHHGSKNSSGEEFIKEVSPDIAIIQCGRNNNYKHPHPETLEVLSKHGILFFRTDLDGDIKIKTNGKNIFY